MLTAALCVAALPACGGDDKGDDEKATLTLSDEDKVGLAIEDFYGGRPEAICDSFTSANLSDIGGRGACLSRAEKQKRMTYNVETIRLGTAGKATALVQAQGRTFRFTLMEERGDWKIDEAIPVAGGGSGG